MTSKLLEFIQASENISEHEIYIDSCKEQSEGYQKQLDNLDKENPDSSKEILEKKIKEIDQQIKKQDEKIQSLKAQKETHEKKVAELGQEKNTLDTDENVLYWKDGWGNDCLDYCNFFGGHGYMVEYKDLPFIKAACFVDDQYVQTMERSLDNFDCRIRLRRDTETGRCNREIKLMNMRRSEGMFRVGISANYNVQSEKVLTAIIKERVEFKIYIKKKDKPENQQRIKEILQEMPRQEAKIQECDEQIVAMQHARESAGELKGIYKDVQKKEEAQTYLAAKKELLATITSLVRQGIVKESNLIKSFQEHYKLYQDLQKGKRLGTRS